MKKQHIKVYENAMVIGLVMNAFSSIHLADKNNN